MKYDLALFLALNAEYARKLPGRTFPTVEDDDKRREENETKARRIAMSLRLFGDISGKRVLDFGCGRGDLSVALARLHGCKVTGVDIHQYSEWERVRQPNVDLRALDLCKPEDAEKLKNQFDFVVSNSVLEHVVHPYSGLQGIGAVLKSDGLAYLKINLYRGPLASHRYRDVHFPWPHLLFTDEVFAEFYEQLGEGPRTASWVNKLTHLHYQQYFEQLGFNVLHESFSITPLDEEFYARFEDRLSRYPRFDLEKDFLNVVLSRRAPTTLDRGADMLVSLRAKAVQRVRRVAARLR